MFFLADALCNSVCADTVDSELYFPDKRINLFDCCSPSLGSYCHSSQGHSSSGATLPKCLGVCEWARAAHPATLLSLGQAEEVGVLTEEATSLNSVYQHQHWFYMKTIDTTKEYNLYIWLKLLIHRTQETLFPFSKQSDEQ